MDQPVITLLPSGARRSFASSTLLADALFDMGVALKTPCGGKGICGKCRVHVKGKSKGVLACQTRITQNLSVYAYPQSPELNFPGLRLEPGAKLAAAVDIGTTTVKIALVDIAGGSSFEVASFLNPQRRYGHDVISRIASSRNPDVFAAMGGLIRKAVRLRLENVLSACGRPIDSLERIVFSGNTTMLYSLFGLDVQPLGRSPYAAPTRDFTQGTPEAIGFPEYGASRIQALPVLSAFIGGDLMGGLTLCRRMGEEKGVFFVDLGTNGELFVIDKHGRIFATSCAMGPALEGMNISWGMTAEEGAITHIHETQNKITYDIIGPGEPVGISGTALIDLMAILLNMGIVSVTGAFSKNIESMDLPAPFEPIYGEPPRALRLTGSIRLTQKDIRNLQLAKAATLSAACFLLDAAKLNQKDIHRVYVAGALGEHVDLENFKRLGFLPEFSNAQWEFIGNTSLKAAEQACLDSGFIKEAATLRDHTREIVLSSQKRFQEVFLQSINFP